MSPADVIIYGVVSLLASMFSGASGAGGGFLSTPTLILLGLAPAQAVASSKFNGLAVAIGSLSGMKQRQNRRLWRRALPVIALAFVIGLAAPFAIQNFDNSLYRQALGVLLLVMVPIVIYKKVGFVKKSHVKRTPAK
ncbi:MAG TPA: TSUP family transporter, partial [Nitrososphaera sp.]|nr:TSUP family transporter [Nitrososphaera sp.]